MYLLSSNHMKSLLNFSEGSLSDTLSNQIVSHSFLAERKKMSLMVKKTMVIIQRAKENDNYVLIIIKVLRKPGHQDKMSFSTSQGL